MEFTETREITINNKIIKLKDVKSLATILQKELEKTKEKDEQLLSWIKYEIKCEEGAIFSTQDINIFEDNSPITKKRVEKITMMFCSHKGYRMEANIDIEFRHGNSFFAINRVKVTGNDATWVNGILKLIEETIDSFTPQNNFIKKYKHLIKIILALGTGISILFCLSFFTSPQTEPQQHSKIAIFFATIPLGMAILKYTTAIICGLLPSQYIYDKLEPLWPQVEIQIGPEHQFIEKQRRIWIANIMVLIVIPFMVSSIYDIYKALFI